MKLSHLKNFIACLKNDLTAKTAMATDAKVALKPYTTSLKRENQNRRVRPKKNLIDKATGHIGMKGLLGRKFIGRQKPLKKLLSVAGSNSPKREKHTLSLQVRLPMVDSFGLIFVPLAELFAVLKLITMIILCRYQLFGFAANATTLTTIDFKTAYGL
jgi:hypothetical protein